MQISKSTNFLVVGLLTAALCLYIVVMQPSHSRSKDMSMLIIGDSIIPAVKAKGTAAGLEHWVPDWYNQTEIGYVLYNRLKNIRERCNSYAGRRNIWKEKPVIRVTHSKSLEYCHTAKAGSTFWSSLLDDARHSKGNRTTLDRGAMMRLTTMRNPWHRLVSTYIQKFSYAGKKKWKYQVETMCTVKFQSQPTFKQFVKYCVLSSWKRKEFNIHWLPITERCDVCNSHYDYIVAVENMAPESDFVLRQAGVRNYKQLFNKTRQDKIRTNEKQGISTSYQTYYRTLDKEYIEALRDLYSFDIHVFQYPETPFVDFVKS